MTRVWLYPVSSTSGYYFEARGKRWPDTSPQSFAEMIREGGADHDWSLTKNYRQVQKGDVVIIYSTQQRVRPPQVIGLAKIKGLPLNGIATRSV